jgi:hypothetical protein
MLPIAVPIAVFIAVLDGTSNIAWIAAFALAGYVPIVIFSSLAKSTPAALDKP